MRNLLGRGRAKKGMFLGDLIEGELEIGQVSSLLNKKLSVWDQSEFGAALGVARLAMYVDKNIDNNSIIKEIEISKDFEPNMDKINILLNVQNVIENYHIGK